MKDEVYWRMWESIQLCFVFARTVRCFVLITLTAARQTVAKMEAWTILKLMRWSWLLMRLWWEASASWLHFSPFIFQRNDRTLQLDVTLLQKDIFSFEFFNGRQGHIIVYVLVSAVSHICCCTRRYCLITGIKNQSYFAVSLNCSYLVFTLCFGGNKQGF